MNLIELIQTHKGDRSYDDLERACDGSLTSQRLQQMATVQPKEFPKAGTVRALALALGVKESVVVLAAAESLGLDVRHEVPWLVQVLPGAASDLNDEEVAAIAHVISAFKREVGGARVHRAAPNKQPTERSGSARYEVPEMLAARADNMTEEEVSIALAAVRKARDERGDSLRLTDDSTPKGETAS